ncbi:MAG: hypothetical protein HQL36_12150 [Alphaproteobacteria bacterium]|nr:hypothetical protein [Alphaproteobacteria bacterium]
MKASYLKRFEDGTDRPNPTPVLVAPKDFDNTSIMMNSTRRALYIARGLPPWIDSDVAKKEHGISVLCKDVEGVDFVF